MKELVRLHNRRPVMRRPVIFRASRLGQPKRHEYDYPGVHQRGTTMDDFSFSQTFVYLSIFISNFVYVLSSKLVPILFSLPAWHSLPVEKATFFERSANQNDTLGALGRNNDTATN